MLKKLKALLPSKEAPQDSVWKKFTRKVMYELLSSRAPLTLSLESTTEQYASLILEVFDDKEVVLLDEPFPRGALNLLKENDKLFISCKSQGVVVNFDAHIVQILDSDVKGIAIAYPKELDYIQRRESFRVMIPRSHPTQFSFILSQVGQLKANVMDVSLTGMRLLVPHNLDKHIKDGQLIQNGRLAIHEQSQVSCQVRVCHHKYIPSRRGTIIGCEFSGLSAEQQQQMNQSVMNLQRLVNQRNNIIKD